MFVILLTAVYQLHVYIYIGCEDSGSYVHGYYSHYWNH